MMNIKVIENRIQQQIALPKLSTVSPINESMPLSTNSTTSKTYALWLELQFTQRLTTQLKKLVGLSFESYLGFNTIKNIHPIKLNRIRQMLGFSTIQNSLISTKGIRESFNDLIATLDEVDQSSFLNKLQRYGLQFSPNKLFFGLKPSLASTSTLQQFLFKTAMSIGVLPLASGSSIFAPASAYFCKTSGKLLYAAQAISSFFFTSTWPDQLAIFPPWIAQWSTFPLSIAPFSLRSSIYSLLQYMPAISRGVCPKLVGLFRMGSPCFNVDRQRGIQGELWEHICARAEAPDESI